MKILYIPFSLEDAFFDLQFKAIKWHKVDEEKGKDVAIVYHGSEQMMKQEKVQQALQAGECKIYILSHGINTPELMVSNQTVEDDTYKVMTINDVAEHFKSDLVIRGFSNDNIVKLFFCDEYGQDNKSCRMAKQFREQLGKAHQAMEIKYYTDVSIGIPGTRIDGLLRAKGAVRSFQMTNDLFYFNLSCVVGRAKNFRQGLDETKAIASKSCFFISSPQKKIKYPEFSHPILKRFAEELVKIVQSDKAFTRNQGIIIDELLQSLPRTITQYLVNSLTINCQNLKLDIRINKPLLESYLIKAGVISPKEKTRNLVSQGKMFFQSRIDEEDSLEVADAQFISKNIRISLA